MGTHPRAADSIGINVTKIRYQSLAVGGALAGLAGAYLSLCQAKMFSDSIVSGRGFIAVALVYFGHWQPVKIMWGALLFSLAQTFQTIIQSKGINFPYEFAVMPDAAKYNALFDKADKKTDMILQDIKTEKIRVSFKRPFGKLVKKHLRNISYSNYSRYGERLSISASCIGCGKCVRLCPNNNITLTKGGKPQFGKDCLA